MYARRKFSIYCVFFSHRSQFNCCWCCCFFFSFYCEQFFARILSIRAHFALKVFPHAMPMKNFIVILVVTNDYAYYEYRNNKRKNHFANWNQTVVENIPNKIKKKHIKKNIHTQTHTHDWNRFSSWISTNFIDCWHMLFQWTHHCNHYNTMMHASH